MTFNEVYSAGMPGIYIFVARTESTFGEFQCTSGESTYTIEGQYLCGGKQNCFFLYMSPGDVIKYKGAEMQLAAVRLGNEL